MAFSWELITVLVLYSVVLIVVTAGKNVLRKKFESGIDYLLNFLNFKRILYKRKSISLAKEFNTLFSDEIIGEIEESITVKIVDEKNTYKKSPKEWKIILVDKTYNVDRAEKSAILQIPSSMIYEKEKLVMSVSYRKAFSMCLSRSLALHKKKFDLVQDIEEEVISNGIEKEFKVISEIIGSNEKFSSFIEEARRKYAFEKGLIGSTNKDEFQEFTRDLSTGKVAVINIVSDVVDSYIAEILRQISTYKYVYVYSRGKSHLKTLRKIHSKLNEKLSKSEISEIEEYDWLDKNGKCLWPAARVKVTRKAKTKKSKKKR